MQERRSVAALSSSPAGGEATRSRRLRTRLTLCCAVIVVLCDQVTKTIAVDELRHGSVHVLGPISFALEYNTGVAFSIGSGLTLPIILVVVVVVCSSSGSSRGVPTKSVEPRARAYPRRSDEQSR